MFKLTPSNAVLVCFFVLTGCAADRVDMLEAGRLRIDSPRIGALSRPSVWARDGILTVYASSTQQATAIHYPNCVEIFIVAPDGKALAHQEATVSYTHAGGPVNRLHLSSYSARFAVIPPDGSVVKVRPCSKHHADPVPR